MIGWISLFLVVVLAGLSGYLYLLYRGVADRLQVLERTTPAADAQSDVETLQADLAANREALEDISRYLLRADDHLQQYRDRLEHLEPRVSQHREALKHLGGLLEGRLARLEAPAGAPEPLTAAVPARPLA
ncbi:MAG: hypothetical protein AAF970_19460 [Bacteroidota bacterium]